MRQSIAFWALLAGVSCTGAEEPSAAFSEPVANIILISVDTLRADHLSCCGAPQGLTPALDELAAQGVVFEQAITPAPLTLPAHCSLMTGALPTAHGVRDNSGFVLPEPVETLAELLSAAGYRTGAFVGAYVLDARFGLEQGFDRYYDDFEAETVGGPTMQILERPAQQVLAEARNWIGERSASPFFAWIHLFDPHAPYAPPPGFEPSYSGEVAYVDASIGQFFTWLRTQGLFDSSLIVLTSDHGEGLGEHGEKTHGMFLYDSTLRVPLIFKLAGSAIRKRIAGQVRLIDVMPTVLDIVGVAIPSSVQGVSLKSAWRGGSLSELPAYGETLLPLLNYGWSDISCYRTARNKFIEAPIPELYDLSADPGETANQLPGNQALANHLKQEKKKLLARFADNAAADAWRAPNVESVERLRSLGYASLARPRGVAAEGDPISALRDKLGSPLEDPKKKIDVFNLVWEAQAASSAGEHRRSNRILDQVFRRDPNIFMAHSIRALSLLQLGRPKEAVVNLRAAAKLRPEDPGGQLYLALAELQLGNLEAAAKGFERTLLLDPESDAARNNLATVYARQKRFKEAETLLADLAQRNPNDPASLLNLGVVRMMQSQLESAREAFRQALRRQPILPEAHNNLGLLHLQSGEPEAAVPELLLAIEQRPGYASAHSNLARAYRLLGRDREAEEQLRLARQSGVRQ